MYPMRCVPQCGGHCGRHHHTNTITALFSSSSTVKNDTQAHRLRKIVNHASGALLLLLLLFFCRSARFYRSTARLPLQYNTHHIYYMRHTKQHQHDHHHHHQQQRHRVTLRARVCRFTSARVNYYNLRRFPTCVLCAHCRISLWRVGSDVSVKVNLCARWSGGY